MRRRRNAAGAEQRWWSFRRRGRDQRVQELDTEPPHDQPWIPRSALTDRLRRSPRR